MTPSTLIVRLGRGSKREKEKERVCKGSLFVLSQESGAGAVSILLLLVRQQKRLQPSLQQLLL